MESMGVASGCDCKEVHVYRFPHITYPYSSCIFFFLQQCPTFCSFKKMFFVLVPVLFVIKFYAKKILRSINTHTGTHTGDYGRPTAAI